MEKWEKINQLIIEHYGYEKQADYYKSLELSELKEEVLKYKRMEDELRILGKTKFKLDELLERLIDEIADNVVMRQQLEKLSFDYVLINILKERKINFMINRKEEIFKRCIFKIERQIERIRAEKNV